MLTSVYCEISFSIVAPKARLIIAASSALVRFPVGSRVEGVLPFKSPLSTAARTASLDHPVGKSAKPLTLAANTVGIAVITIINVIMTARAFLIIFDFILFPP